jgi:Uma2 family endonuclease
MAILEHDVRSVDKLTLTSTHRLQFTRDQYYSIGETGALSHARTELIEGQIVDMAPIGRSHATGTVLLHELLREAFGNEYTVRPQLPISITSSGSESEPQPDIVVARGSGRDYALRHPSAGEVVLIVEISDSSLTYDQTIKAALYAASGIAEYWILNIVDQRLEVYREPSDAAYAKYSALHSGDAVKPLAAPGKSISISDFLI